MRWQGILVLVVGLGLGVVLAVFCECLIFASLDWLSSTGGTFWAWVGRGFKKGPPDGPCGF